MRGLDSEGHVANFVETEQIVQYNGGRASFVQVCCYNLFEFEIGFVYCSVRWSRLVMVKIPHVTIFCIFWLHECLNWRLKLNLKVLFWCKFTQTFKVWPIEQLHHKFQLTHMPPYQFWPQYCSDGLWPLHIYFGIFTINIFVYCWCSNLSFF